MLKLHDNYNPSPYPSAIQWIVTRCKQCLSEEQWHRDEDYRNKKFFCDDVEIAKLLIQNPSPLVRVAYDNDIYDDKSHHNHREHIGSLDWSLSINFGNSRDNDYVHSISRFKSIENNQVYVKGFKIIGSDIHISACADDEWNFIDDIFEHMWLGIRFYNKLVELWGFDGVVYVDPTTSKYLYQLFGIPIGDSKTIGQLYSQSYRDYDTVKLTSKLEE